MSAEFNPELFDLWRAWLKPDRLKIYFLALVLQSQHLPIRLQPAVVPLNWLRINKLMTHETALRIYTTTSNEQSSLWQSHTINSAIETKKEKTLLNLDPLSEVTQLNNYSYHEAKNKTASDLFIFVLLLLLRSIPCLKPKSLPRKARAMRKGEAVDSKTREWKCI